MGEGITTKKSRVDNDVRKMRGFLETVRKENKIHSAFIKNADELFESLDELILLMDTFSKEDVLRVAHRLARRRLEAKEVEGTLATMREDVAVRRKEPSDRKVDWLNFSDKKTDWIEGRR
jgi:hypothetical protein